MKALFEIIKVGIQITVQDRGREKYRHLGIPVSGAMDQFAFQIGNILLGNNRFEACLEITIGGTKLKAINDQQIVITGGNLTPTIDGECIKMYKVIHVKKGQIITFQGQKNGVYAYIAVPNGVYSNNDFESQSSYEKANLGLMISNGTIIYGKEDSTRKKVGLIKAFIPNYSEKEKVNFIKSSHFESISEQVKNKLVSKELTVGTSNRMGMYLFSKQSIQLCMDSNILSEATTYGTIQILPDGNPIILLSDSQTTGGYKTLGTIIYSDLWKVAQLQQGKKLILTPIEIDEAKILNMKFERFIRSLMIECSDIQRRI